MMSLDVLLSFLVTAAVFAAVPGPATVYVAAQTLTGGRAAGLTAMVGVHLGGYVHLLTAASGLAFLIQGTPAAVATMKLLGAAYLAWLGLSLIRSQTTTGDTIAAARPDPRHRTFVEGITVQALNPTAAIFYIAFLPQFVDVSVSLPVWAQFLCLGVVVNLIFTAPKLFIVLAGTITPWWKPPFQGQRRMRRVAGSTLVAMAVHLTLWGQIG